MDTTENNKLIAQFMGIEICEGIKLDLNHKFVTELFYNSSWDWLMPVIYRIKWLENFDAEELEEKCEDIDAGLTNVLLEQTYKAVTEFIK